jgi:hypothetical protein
MHLYFVNITVNARLIKNRLFFLYGFSSFQCQYEFLGNITQYLYKNKKTTSNIKTSRTINLTGRTFYFVTQTSHIQNSGVVHCALLIH